MGRPPNCNCNCGCGQSTDLVVVGHEYVQTAEGLGNVSALDWLGNLLWTVDLGTESGTGRRKVPNDIAIDTKGKILIT